MEGISGIANVIGKLLEIFKQKAYVFVEVNVNTEKPYVLTVLNRSSFDILLNSIKADPDGFPEENNGLMINGAALFRNKRLKPGQSIRLFFTSKEIGKYDSRKFTINYSTYFTENKLVPRLEQECNHEFCHIEHTTNVRVSAKITQTIY